MTPRTRRVMGKRYRYPEVGDTLDLILCVLQV